MNRRIIREAWTLTTVAEAQVVHDALGLVRDALGDDLDPAAKLDLNRVLRELTIFNAPYNSRGGRWEALRRGGQLKIEMGAELLHQVRIALELLADWTVENAKNDPDGPPPLTPDQADALVAIRASIDQVQEAL